MFCFLFWWCKSLSFEYFALAPSIIENSQLQGWPVSSMIHTSTYTHRWMDCLLLYCQASHYRFRVLDIITLHVSQNQLEAVSTLTQLTVYVTYAGIGRHAGDNTILASWCACSKGRWCDCCEPRRIDKHLHCGLIIPGMGRPVWLGQFFCRRWCKIWNASPKIGLQQPLWLRGTKIPQLFNKHSDADPDRFVNVTHRSLPSKAWGGLRGC